MSDKNKNRFLWSFFFFSIVLALFYIISETVGFKVEKSSLFQNIILAIPIALLLLHSFFTMSPLRAIVFISIACFIGFVMELWGLKSGTFFGGYYVYKPNHITIFSVPISVILYWAVFTYSGYCIVNSFLLWLNKKKPVWKQNYPWLIPLLVFIDGIIVVTIDLFMDPIQVKAGKWTWIDGGPYFGVPLGNFIGWFLVVVLATGIFRSLEYIFPHHHEKNDKSLYLIPVLCYGILSIFFAYKAIYYQMIELAFLGTALMMSVVLINLILFRKYRKSVTD